MEKRGGLAELTATVDGEVFAFVNEVFNFVKSVGDAHHIVFVGNTRPCNIKFAHSVRCFDGFVVRAKLMIFSLKKKNY